MKINIREYLSKSPNSIEWALIELMSQKGSISNTPEFDPHQKCNADELEVVVTINGIEVDFIKLIQEMDRQSDRMIREKAKDLLDTKYSAIHESLEQIKNKIDFMVLDQKDTFDY